jgi:uncharacterized repeat protein (TIGR03803 family)
LVLSYTFSGGTDGSWPYAGVVLDKTGNVYGTTCCGGDSGLGNVFELSPSGNLTNLYSFLGAPDGAVPVADLIFDKKGNLYGTTEFGGSYVCAGGYGCGTVFEVIP